MTEAGAAAYIQSQSACAMIEAMGMQAENQQRAVEDKSMAYTEEDFEKLLNRYEIGYNSAMHYLSPQ